jgi:hypothetical protein
VSGYQVTVYDLTLKTTNTITTGASVTSYTPAAGALAPGDSFVWNVRGVFGSSTGPVSNYLFFQIPAMPAPTGLTVGGATSPGPLLSTDTPTFTWNAVSGVTGYQINVYDMTLKKLSIFKVDASVTSFTPAAGALTPYDSFIYNIRCVDGTVTGPESVYLYFQLPA